MRDVYTESVVPASSNPLYRIVKVILIILAGACVFAAGYASFLFLIPAALFGYLAYSVSQKAGAEYEYVHTNDCFDVDIVISNSRRKHLLSVNLDQVALIASADAPEMSPYRNLTGTNFSGNAAGEELYAMVYTEEGKRKKLLLKMEPNMLRSLKTWIPEKVK